MNNTAYGTNASDIYHSFLDDAHSILNQFQLSNNVDLYNKMNVFWGNLHRVSNSSYVYFDGDQKMQLSQEEAIAIDDIISGASTARLNEAAKSLEALKNLLLEKNLLN